MKRALLAAILAVAFTPALASADHRGGGHSSFGFGLSLGGGGYGGFFSYGRGFARPYYYGGVTFGSPYYTPYYAPYYAPRYVAPAPVYVTPGPVYTAPPAYYYYPQTYYYYNPGPVIGGGFYYYR